MLGLLSVTGATLATVWYSETATQKVLDLVQDAVPGLSWEKVEGSLSSGVTFTNLQFITPKYRYLPSASPEQASESIPTLVDFHAYKVATAIDLVCLSQFQVCLRNVVIDNAQLAVATGNETVADKTAAGAYDQVSALDLAEVLPPSPPGGGAPAWLDIKILNGVANNFTMQLGKNIGQAQLAVNKKLRAQAAVQAQEVVGQYQELLNSARDQGTSPHNLDLKLQAVFAQQPKLLEQTLNQVAAAAKTAVEQVGAQVAQEVTQAAGNQATDNHTANQAEAVGALSNQAGSASSSAPVTAGTTSANTATDSLASDSSPSSPASAVEAQFAKAGLAPLSGLQYVATLPEIDGATLVDSPFTDFIAPTMNVTVGQLKVGSFRYTPKLYQADGLSSAAVGLTFISDRSDKATELANQVYTKVTGKLPTTATEAEQQAQTHKTTKAQSSQNLLAEILPPGLNEVFGEFFNLVDGAYAPAAAKLPQAAKLATAYSQNLNLNLGDLFIPQDSKLVAPTTKKGLQVPASQISEKIEGVFAKFKQPLSSYIVSQYYYLPLPMTLETAKVNLGSFALTNLNYDSDLLLVNAAQTALGTNKQTKFVSSADNAKPTTPTSQPTLAQANTKTSQTSSKTNQTNTSQTIAQPTQGSAAGSASGVLAATATTKASATVLGPDYKVPAGATILRPANINKTLSGQKITLDDGRQGTVRIVKGEKVLVILPKTNVALDQVAPWLTYTQANNFHLASVNINGDLGPTLANLKLKSEGDLIADLSVDYNAQATQLDLNLDYQANNLPFTLPFTLNGQLALKGQLNRELALTLENASANAQFKIAGKIDTASPWWPVSLQADAQVLELGLPFKLTPLSLTLKGKFTDLEARLAAQLAADDLKYQVSLQATQKDKTLSTSLTLDELNKLSATTPAAPATAAAASSDRTQDPASQQAKDQASQLSTQASQNAQDAGASLSLAEQLEQKRALLKTKAPAHLRLVAGLGWEQDLQAQAYASVSNLRLAPFIPSLQELTLAADLNLVGVYRSYQDWSVLATPVQAVGRFNGEDFDLGASIHADAVAGINLYELKANYINNSVNLVGKVARNSDLALQASIENLAPLVKGLDLQLYSDLRLQGQITNPSLLGTLRLPKLTYAPSNLRVSGVRGDFDLKWDTSLQGRLGLAVGNTSVGDFTISKLGLWLDGEPGVANGSLISATALNQNASDDQTEKYNLALNLPTFTGTSLFQPLTSAQAAAARAQAGRSWHKINPYAVLEFPLLVNKEVNKEVTKEVTKEVDKNPASTLPTSSSNLSATTVQPGRQTLNLELESNQANLKLAIDNLLVLAEGYIEGKLYLYNLDVKAADINGIRMAQPAGFSLRSSDTQAEAKLEAKVEPFRLVNDNFGITTKAISYQPTHLTAGLNLDYVNMAYVNNFLKPLKANLSGELKGSVDLDLNPKAVQSASTSINANIESTRLVYTQPVNFAPLRVALDDLKLTADVKGDDASLEGSFLVNNRGSIITDLHLGNLFTTRTLGGGVSINNISLDLIKPLLDQTQQVEGLLNAELSFEGDVGKPLLYGGAQLTDLNVAMADLPFEIRDGNLDVEFNGQAATLTGNLPTNSTPIQVSGDMNWSDLTDLRSTVKASTKDLDLRLLTFGNAKLDTNLVADLRGNAITARGDVKLHNADISVGALPNSVTYTKPSSDIVFVDNNFKPILTAKEKAALARAEREANRINAQKGKVNASNLNARQQANVDGFNIDAQVKVNIADNVRLQAYGADITLVGDLDVGYNNRTGQRIVGNVRIDKGTFAAYGQNLLVQRGLVTFNGVSVIPNVDFRAIRNPDFVRDDVTVGIQVTGPATKPRVGLFSVPQMRESQQINYLLTGSSSDSDDSVGLQLLTSSLTSSLSVIENVGKSLGIQNLQLSTAKSGSNSQLTLSGTVLKKLRVNYAYGLFNGLTELSASYQLLPKVFLRFSKGISTALDAVYRVTF